jgi:hypothetical protein
MILHPHVPMQCVGSTSQVGQPEPAHARGGAIDSAVVVDDLEAHIVLGTDRHSGLSTLSVAGDIRNSFADGGKQVFGDGVRDHRIDRAIEDDPDARRSVRFRHIGLI